MGVYICIQATCNHSEALYAAKKPSALSGEAAAKSHGLMRREPKSLNGTMRVDDTIGVLTGVRR